MSKKVYKYHFIGIAIYSTNLRGCEFDSEFLKIYPDGEIVVHGTKSRPYAWDGCSPKIEFLDMFIGTPDGKYIDYPEILSIDGKGAWLPITFFASMLHDAIYQNKAEVPITRYEADNLFRLMLERKYFSMAGLYYYAVRTFGGLMGKWKVKGKRKKEINLLNVSIAMPDETYRRIDNG